MGQRTAIIMQKIYKDGNYVVGATLGFYCQWGPNVLLFRDINDLLQRVKIRSRFLDLNRYNTWSKANGKISKPEYYSIVEGKFVEAPTLRHISCNKKNLTVNNTEVIEKLEQIYNAHENFFEAWGKEASYPFMEYMDVYISKYLDKIDENNLWKYIPIEDFRNEKYCKKYFSRFHNNDGGALITLYGGTDYSPDIKECRIIDGRDKYGKFVSPDYYINQYIENEINGDNNVDYVKYLEKNYKNFINLIKDFQECKIIKE